MSLGSPDRLARYLRLTPGSVTLLGLINDPDHQVELLVDAEVWTEAAWRCHPLVNTATLVLSRENVERFIRLTGHEPTIVEVPARSLDESRATE